MDKYLTNVISAAREYMKQTARVQLPPSARLARNNLAAAIEQARIEMERK